MKKKVERYEMKKKTKRCSLYVPHFIALNISIDAHQKGFYSHILTTLTIGFIVPRYCFKLMFYRSFLRVLQGVFFAVKFTNFLFA